MTVLFCLSVCLSSLFCAFFIGPASSPPPLSRVVRAEPELEGEGRRTLLPLWASGHTPPVHPSGESCIEPVIAFSLRTAPRRVPPQACDIQASFEPDRRWCWWGDRAKLVEARIREEVHPARLDWISALRGPAIRTPVETDAVQRLLFDEQDLVGIRSDLYLGERLMVCRTPLMAQRRAHRREALLEATEALLESVVAATTREKRRLKGEDRIGARVGTVIGRYRMAKHITWAIDEHGVFHSERQTESIVAEAARMASPSSLPACPRQHPVRPVLMSCGLRACSRPRAWPRARDMTPHSGDGLHSLACSRPARRQQRHSYPDAHQARQAR